MTRCSKRVPYSTGASLTSGYTTSVKIVEADCAAWFPADVVKWRDDPDKEDA